MTNNTQERILIVDDVTKNIQMVANILNEQGYHMSFAQNGETALELAKSEHFDLILLDIMMPEMDGFQVCQVLKDSENTKDIPIIFLTAKTDSDSIVKGFEMGAVDYVTKPFESSELLARVRTHLKLRRTVRELEEANEELRELNLTKDKFFSIIAHDLKGPFNVLISGSQLLVQAMDQFKPEEIRRISEEMLKSSKNSFDLLQNLLNWARIQMNKMEFVPEYVDLNKIVRASISILQPNADLKGITLSHTLEPDTFLYADSNSVNTVVRNLISNAVKFTNTGGQVSVSARPLEDSIEICVSDTGVGIPEKDIERLFRVDGKYRTPGTADEKGTGLGLILCKDLIEKNNGVIWVESELGKGSHFKFTLPKAHFGDWEDD